MSLQSIYSVPPEAFIAEGVLKRTFRWQPVLFEKKDGLFKKNELTSGREDLPFQ